MVKKLFTLSLYCLGAIILLNSCSKIISDDPEDYVSINQYYTVHYDATDSTTKATAVLRARSSTGEGITLSEKVYLAINDVTPNKDPIASLTVPTYTWNSTGIKDVSFVLTKKNHDDTYGTSINTKYDVPVMMFPQGMPTSYSKINGIYFNIATLTDDKFDLTITGKNMWGRDTILTKETDRYVVVYLTELDIFQPGTIDMSIEWNKRFKVEREDYTGGGHADVSCVIHRSFTLN